MVPSSWFSVASSSSSSSVPGRRRADERRRRGRGGRRREEPTSLLRVAGRVGAGVCGAAGLILASQALYVALVTPRLPPPPGGAGRDFPKDGLLVARPPSDEDDDENDDDDELRLVLLGDSPVEGVGNESHAVAVGGRTAEALARASGRPVRYWAFGVSGLTARGVAEKTLDLLDDVAPAPDVVAVSCGVNNVLWGQSAATFGRELRWLLSETRKRFDGPVLLLELLDFARMPFLPRPLSDVLSWRSRVLRDEAARVVRQDFRDDDRVTIAALPPVDEVSSSSSSSSSSLGDFFAADGFHPAGRGTALVGEVLANAWRDVVARSPRPNDNNQRRRSNDDDDDDTSSRIDLRRS